LRQPPRFLIRGALPLWRDNVLGKFQPKWCDGSCLRFSNHAESLNKRVAAPICHPFRHRAPRRRKAFYSRLSHVTALDVAVRVRAGRRMTPVGSPVNEATMSPSEERTVASPGVTNQTISRYTRHLVPPDSRFQPGFAAASRPWQTHSAISATPRRCDAAQRPSRLCWSGAPFTAPREEVDPDRLVRSYVRGRRPDGGYAPQDIRWQDRIARTHSRRQLAVCGRLDKAVLSRPSVIPEPGPASNR